MCIIFFGYGNWTAASYRPFLPLIFGSPRIKQKTNDIYIIMKRNLRAFKLAIIHIFLYAVCLFDFPNLNSFRKHKNANFTLESISILTTSSRSAFRNFFVASQFRPGAKIQKYRNLIFISKWKLRKNLTSENLEEFS